MDFHAITFDVCRCYVNDNRGLLGDERANRILGWIRSRDLKSLASCVSLDGFAFANPELLRALKQIEAFFKKNAIYTEPTSARQAAILAFERGERICRITNRRLEYYYLQRERLAPDLQLYAHRAEVWIRRVLGPFDDFFEDLPRRVRLTSGATSHSPRRASAPHLKLSLQMRCTSAARPYLVALGRHYGFDRVRPRVVTSNRVEFVPKSWKTDRTIACEPEGNLPLQLAFDGYAKDRLRRFGIDLSDQTLNQRLAVEGSISGSFATVDLSMASDTLSFNAVAWLLPRPWFRYLADVRSLFGRVNGRILRYAKFSSMGNGATFALETLIFAAACHAVGSKAFSVYGDDIIIETELASKLLRFLRFLGFIPNPDKTFVTGPFRESCGVDSYQGINITPFYVRTWSGLKAQICHNVNGLVSIAKIGGELMLWCKNTTLQLNLPLVPGNEDTMSGVMIDNHSAYSKKLIRTQHSIPYFRAYKPRSKSRAVRDSRTYYLWHLNRYRRRLYHEDDVLISSRVPAFSHKYVRKWVLWTNPEVGAADHLYWWSALLMSADLTPAD